MLSQRLVASGGLRPFDAFDLDEQPVEESEVFSKEPDDGCDGRRVGKKFALGMGVATQLTLSTDNAYDCGPYCRVVQMTPDCAGYFRK